MTPGRTPTSSIDAGWRGLFAPFEPDRICYEDEDVIVVDKPFGWSTDTGDGGGVLSHLRAFLAARDGVPVDRVYVGLHHRLPRDVSGAQLFTRRRSANGAIAAQITAGLREQRDAGGHRVESITFVAPSDGRSRTVRVPVRDPSSLETRLRDCARRRLDLCRTTQAFRLVHADGDGFPGLTVDRYADWALVQFYEDRFEGGADRRAAVLDAVAALGPRGVYAKFRPRRADDLVDTRRDDLAPSHALRGQDAPAPFPVLEHDCTYHVRLGDGLSTGIFLDQRDNRRRVQQSARGRSVLNLFAYTGAFSVAAARGSASRTVTVDVSHAACERARENLRANGCEPGDTHTVVASDVFGWLEGAAKRWDRFDLVVLDPPSFATTAGARFSARDDYGDLVRRVAPLLAPGAALLACTNQRNVTADTFERTVARAFGDTRVRTESLRTPDDFPPPPGAPSHLKSVWVRMR